MEEYLKQLNKSQLDAVVYTDGPSLVIAGAGSGKTRVLTCKISYLLNKGIPPYRILALTFTNKAAREMKERIASIAGEPTARQLWMGTFHSIFARILRTEVQYTGYSSNFTIYDATDSKSLLKAIIKEMQLDDKVYRPGMVQSRISSAKNALITARSYEQNKDMVEYDMKAKVPLIRDIYKRYESRCLQAGAMDFDDLLLQMNILFRDHPAVLEKYRQFFQYILVDEYQDTNFAQHLIVQRLSEIHGHLTVVGDDAQSIYSFRGANIDNILQLKSVYPACRTFKLERNYRSTQNIVNAANSLIHKNREQIHKTIYSEKEEGSKLLAFSTYSDYEEGYAIASKIEEMKRKRKYEYADFAVLYRTNAQSRIPEEALRKKGIPYKIYGGLSFYQRKEIKDVIAYFRMIVNPHDEEALKRIINYPSRGIGDTTVGKLVSAASDRNVSLWSVLKEPMEYAVKVNGGTAGKLSRFRELIESFITYGRENSAEDTATFIVKRSEIYSTFLTDQSVEGISRRENLEELLKGIVEFSQIRREEGIENVSIADFLSEVALLSDQDNDRNEFSDKVTLMTVHAAKGLEFKNVFVAGLEEDLFPSQMSKDSMRAIEEERRLFYVAITRAEENCVLSYAKSRFRNGKTSVCSPSRFLKDIDRQYLESTEGSFARAGSFEKEGEIYERPAFQSPFRQKQPVEVSSRIPLPATSPVSSGFPPINIEGLQVGSHIRHDRFGEGEVIAIEGEGGNTKATVVFTHFGQKQLLLKFAKFTVLR